MACAAIEFVHPRASISCVRPSTAATRACATVMVVAVTTDVVLKAPVPSAKVLVAAGARKSFVVLGLVVAVAVAAVVVVAVVVVDVAVVVVVVVAGVPPATAT